MSITTTASNTMAHVVPSAGNETYAYRRFGGGPARPSVFLQLAENLPNAVLLAPSPGTRRHSSRRNRRSHPIERIGGTCSCSKEGRL